MYRFINATTTIYIYIYYTGEFVYIFVVNGLYAGREIRRLVNKTPLKSAGVVYKMHGVVARTDAAGPVEFTKPPE